MNSDWLGSTSDRLNSGLTAFSTGVSSLAQPRRQHQIRVGLCILAVVWMAWALSQMVWLLLPRPETAAMPTDLVNPQSGSGRAAARAAVNIEELAGWELFGKPQSTVPAAVVEAKPKKQETPKGIEDGARETRLNLKLQGLVASPVEEEARAIIEHKKKQEQYYVGDKLPVSGRVTLAKVLNDRVVLNNNGKYELLLLFDKKSMSAAAMRPPEPERLDEDDDEGDQRNNLVDQRNAREVTEMAENYRQRLYTDPSSLAQAVRISAQRVDGQLQGYRVSPGRDKEQFEKLGFQPNDVVTGVNGIELTDPGKAMELYKVMRSAEEASFSVLRDGQQITLVVGLESVADTE